MKKCLSIILCAVLVFSMSVLFTGCGASEQDKFIGTWETELDMTDYLNDAITEEDEDMGEYIKFKDFSLVVQIEFKDDATYEMSVDKKAAEKAIEALREDFEKGIIEYFEAYLEEAGVDMTVEEALEESGMSIEDLMDEALGDELLDEITSGFESEGNFSVEDGKLFMSDDLDSDIDEDEYETYEISEDKLKLIKYHGEEDLEGLEDLYPMTFKKID